MLTTAHTTPIASVERFSRFSTRRNKEAATGTITATPWRVRALAFDLGLANFAAGAIESDDAGILHCRGVRLIRTAKDRGSGHERVRAAMDDARRALEIADNVEQMIVGFKPDVIGYESYQVYDDATIDDLRAQCQRLLAVLGWTGRGLAPGVLAALVTSPGTLVSVLQAISGLLESAVRTRGRGDAAKVLLVQGVVIAAAHRHNIPHYAFLPTDLRRHLLGRVNGTKEDVENAVRAKVQGFDTACADKKIAKSNVNHVADAVGHATLTLETFKKYHR
jgi:Holliday junction resolvasome RuvABC endonuclease subunit